MYRKHRTTLAGDASNLEGVLSSEQCEQFEKYVSLIAVNANAMCSRRQRRRMRLLAYRMLQKVVKGSCKRGFRRPKHVIIIVQENLGCGRNSRQDQYLKRS